MKKSPKPITAIPIPIAVDPALDLVIANPAPIPPIVDIAPTIIIPAQPLPTNEQPLLPVFQSHPIEPMPSYSQSKPKLYRLPTIRRRIRKPVKNENTCHLPTREHIPNAVCPSILPKHICEVKYAPKINSKTGAI